MLAIHKFYTVCGLSQCYSALVAAFFVFYLYLNQLTTWIENLQHHALFDLVSLFISIAFAAVGFVLARRTIKDGERQEKEIRSQRKHLANARKQLEKLRNNLTKTTVHLEWISESMSTCYVDSFPNNLKPITKLIETAERDFWILADCADYGSFSDPDGHEEMIRAIEAVCKANLERKKKLNIEIRMCGAPQLISRSSPFWKYWNDSENNPDLWRVLCENKEFNRQLQAFCTANNIDVLDLNPADCKREQFKKQLQDKHNRIERHLHDVLKIPMRKLTFLEHMPGIFFWMRDGKEAVFLLSHTGDGTQGIAFITHDSTIINILNNTWNSVLADNSRGVDNDAAFKQHQSVENFLALYSNVKQDDINAVIQFCK